MESPGMPNHEEKMVRIQMPRRLTVPLEISRPDQQMIKKQIIENMIARLIKSDPEITEENCEFSIEVYEPRPPYCNEKLHVAFAANPIAVKPSRWLRVGYINKDGQLIFEETLVGLPFSKFQKAFIVDLINSAPQTMETF